MNRLSTIKTKPFLKWAGGKSQLLQEIEKRLPFSENDVFTYIEPFVGGGAVLFWILNNYKNIDKVVINDVNSDLINTYRQISSNTTGLIDLLMNWQEEYYNLYSNKDAEREYYYNKRSMFNSQDIEPLTKAALLIFLNRTCFNGLYRVNKSGGFNVPVGSYKRPLICDINNLNNVSEILQKVNILNTDFENTFEHINKNTFVYFDPPYKPLNPTSNFNSYAKNGFDDEEQVRLKEYCDKLNLAGAKWMLSNSDPISENGKHFFEELYKGYRVEKVLAKRNINSKSEKRGEIFEVLISNY